LILLQVVIQPDASAEIEAAVDYYAWKVSEALAEQFVTEFQAACAILARRPGMGSLRFAHLLEGRQLRTWSLRRFPYRLFYVVEADMLNIVGVEHQRRDTMPT